MLSYHDKKWENAGSQDNGVLVGGMLEPLSDNSGSARHGGVEAVKPYSAGILPWVREVFPDLWTTLADLATIGRWTGGNDGYILQVVRGTGILPLCQV